MKKFSSEQIFEGIVSNDTRVLEHVYSSSFPMIMAYVRAHGGSSEDAFDVFQDAIVVILQRLRRGTLVLNCSFNTFLLSVVKIIFYHLKKVESLRNTVDLDLNQLTEEIQEIDDGLLDTYEKNLKVNLIQRHFVHLSEGCQTLMMLYSEGVSIREISDIMGVSESFVKKKKYECKQKLIKRIMAEEGSKELFYD